MFSGVAAPRALWRWIQRAVVALAGTTVLGGSVVACGHFGTDAWPDATTVVSVSPAGGSAAVPTASPIVITFSRPMRMAAEMNVSLLEGGVAGSLVPGAATWSTDRTVLTFTPSSPLKAGTGYTLRIGGGMMDANDRPMDYGGCRSWGGQPSSGGGMVFTFTTA